MSGDQLRDAWTTIEVDPEGAATQVVAAQQAAVILGRMDTALRSLLVWFPTDLDAMDPEAAENLAPVLAMRTTLMPVTCVDLPPAIPSADRPVSTDSWPCTPDQARAMVRTRPHEAAGWLVDGYETPFHHDQWSRAILAMLGHHRPDLVSVGTGRSAFDTAMAPVVLLRTEMVAMARSGTVAALDEAPSIMAWLGAVG